LVFNGVVGAASVTPACAGTGTGAGAAVRARFARPLLPDADGRRCPGLPGDTTTGSSGRGAVAVSAGAALARGVTASRPSTTSEEETSLEAGGCAKWPRPSDAERHPEKV
jgi:hypothetical protein